MPELLLKELRPKFLKLIDDRTYQRVRTVGEADGLSMLCPKCLDPGKTGVGVHSIICWSRHVPQKEGLVGPGRWDMRGTSFDDLSLVGASNSVLLTGGCAAHFFVTDGRITMA